MNTGPGIDSNGRIEVNGIIIDPDTREVSVDGEFVRLTPIEFSILTFLASNKNRVMTNQIIYETIWDEEFLGTKNSIMVHIRKIREKIEKDPRNPEFIKTVWGVGYKLEG
jgi:DNA-binding response OmpR family regulator